MSKNMTIARPYAKAIFELASQGNSFKEWSLLLERLALVAENQTMQPVFNNPLVSKQELADMFINLAKDVLTTEGENLINLLAQKKRLPLLPAIAKLYELLVAERERTIEVKVISAYPIDQNRLQRLTHALQDNLKRQVTIHCSIDQSLLGGAVIYAGDRVIDGSLRSKLKRLSERLCS